MLRVIMTINQYRMMELVILQKGKKEINRVRITEWKRADFSAVGEAAARAPRGCSEHKEPQQSWLSPSRAAPRAPLQQRDPGVPQAAASSLRAAEMKGILQKT